MKLSFSRRGALAAIKHLLVLTVYDLYKLGGGNQMGQNTGSLLSSPVSICLLYRMQGKNGLHTKNQGSIEPNGFAYNLWCNISLWVERPGQVAALGVLIQQFAEKTSKVEIKVEHNALLKHQPHVFFPGKAVLCFGFFWTVPTF